MCGGAWPWGWSGARGGDVFVVRGSCRLTRACSWFSCFSCFVSCQDNFGHGEVTLVSSVAVFVSCVRGHVFHVLSLVVRRVGSSRSAWTRACVEARGGDASVMCGGSHVTCACWCFLPLLSGLVWAKWDLFSVRVKSSWCGRGRRRHTGESSVVSQ